MIERRLGVLMEILMNVDWRMVGLLHWVSCEGGRLWLNTNYMAACLIDVESRRSCRELAFLNFTSYQESYRKAAY